MESAAQAESIPPYRHAYAGPSGLRCGPDEELAKIVLGVRLRALLEFSRRLLVQARVARQAADLDDLVQEVLCSMAPKIRTRPLADLLKLVRKAVRWRAADYLRVLRKRRLEESMVDDVAAEPTEELRPVPERPGCILFLSTLSPRKARLCSAILTGCTGVAELARVARVAEEDVGPLLAKALSRARAFCTGREYLPVFGGAAPLIQMRPCSRTSHGCLGWQD